MAMVVADLSNPLQVIYDSGQRKWHKLKDKKFQVVKYTHDQARALGKIQLVYMYSVGPKEV